MVIVYIRRYIDSDATVPVLFLYCDFVVWLHAMIR